MPYSHSQRPPPPEAQRTPVGLSGLVFFLNSQRLSVACRPIPSMGVAGIEFRSCSLLSRCRVAKLCSPCTVGQESSQGLGCEEGQPLCKRPDYWVLLRPGKVPRLCEEGTTVRAEDNSAQALCSLVDLLSTILPLLCALGYGDCRLLTPVGLQ